MLELLTQDKDFFPPALAAKLRAVREAGFDGFEIDGKWLLHEFEQVRRAVRDTGVPVPTACGGYRGWIGDFNDAKRQQALDDVALMLRRLAERGQRRGGAGGLGHVLAAPAAHDAAPEPRRRRGGLA